MTSMVHQDLPSDKALALYDIDLLLPDIHV